MARQGTQDLLGLMIGCSALAGVACNSILGNDQELHLTGAGGSASSSATAPVSSSTSSSATTSSTTSSGLGGSSSSSGTSATTSSSASSTSGGGAGGGACVPPSGAQQAAALGLPTPFVPIADGMQCGSSKIDPVDGRAGGFFTFNDGTKGASQTPAAKQPFLMTLLSSKAGDPDYLQGVSYAARTFGMGFTQWGAGMGLNLASGPMKQPAYDALAHGYQGVAFLARSPSSTPAVFGAFDQWGFPDAGKCDPSMGSATPCNDVPQAALALTPAWKVFAFHWAELKPSGWGLADPQGFVDASTLYNLQFTVLQNTTFDLEVTELGFFQ